MFDETLVKDLAEMLGKSLTFTDIGAVGAYLFKNHTFDLHELAGVDREVSISPLKAARILVEESERKGRLKELFAFAIELDGAPLNSRLVELQGLENLLYRLARTGRYYDFGRRRFVVAAGDRCSLPNWGALKDGREYRIAIASVDICRNSELVKRHRTGVMEKVYYRLWEFLKCKLELWHGRIWTWAGDGGILAFRGDRCAIDAVSCCLEIMATLPVFNLQPDKPIREDLRLRVGVDVGPVKFFSDTGRIVSGVINYAAHLEKKCTKPCCLSVSDAIYEQLPPAMRKEFPLERQFEGRIAYSTG